MLLTYSKQIQNLLAPQYFTLQILMGGHSCSYATNLPFFATLALLLLLSPAVYSQQPKTPLAVASSSRIYCSSMCADYTTACSGPTSQECLACDSHFFKASSQNGVCQSLQQKLVISHQLKNEEMELDGYKTTKASPVSCGPYSLSGEYVAGDYLSKTFQIPESYGGHYEIAIKFVIGYIGAWTNTDQIYMKLNGKQYTYNYSCFEPTQQCSSSSIDCMKFVSQTIKHDEGDLTFNISSNLVETDSSVKYWGLREMVIIMKTCASSCSQCFGPLESECLACEDGFYLLGNSCVKKCPFLKVEKSHYCVQSCPQGYFSQNQACETCNPDCLTCSNAQSCIIYKDGSTGEPFITKNLLSFIILILLCLLLVAFLVWKLVFDRKNKKVSDEIDSGINDRIIDAQDLTQEKNSKKKSKEGSKGEDKELGEQNNTFSTIKFNSKQYPDQLNQKSFEDVNMKWIDPAPQFSQAYINTQQIAPRKKRNAKMKRPQALNSPGSLQIKKKDELDEYYDGDGNISIDNKQL